jgi:hypothetical protein
LKAAAIGSLLAFAVGWIMGPIRQFWAVPHFRHIVGVLLDV